MAGDFQKKILALVAENPSVAITVDLEEQCVSLPNEQKTTFPIDPFSKKFLLEGIDQLGYLLKHEQRISAYEKSTGRLI